jgi:long-chain acyl-CoA synthetase
LYSEQKEVFGYKEDGIWKTCSAKDYINLANQVSTPFLRMGIWPGDRVATIIRNSPEWNLVDMGLLQIGAIQVSVYPTMKALG